MKIISLLLFTSLSLSAVAQESSSDIRKNDIFHSPGDVCISKKMLWERIQRGV